MQTELHAVVVTGRLIIFINDTLKYMDVKEALCPSNEMIHYFHTRYFRIYLCTWDPTPGQKMTKYFYTLYFTIRRSSRGFCHRSGRIKYVFL